VRVVLEVVEQVLARRVRRQFPLGRLGNGRLRLFGEEGGRRGDANELAGVSAGDEISFTLAVTETDDWIEQVQRVGKTNAFGLSGPPGWHIAEPELSVGDTLPDYEFVDEHGKAVRLSRAVRCRSIARG